MLLKPEIEQNGTSIEGVLYTPNGEGPFPTVILTHGFTGNYTYITGNIAKELAKAGFAAYAFNLRNPDTRSMLNTSVLTEAATLDTVIDQIKALDCVDPEQIFLLGESQGGFVSAYVAARREDIHSAIILGIVFSLSSSLIPAVLTLILSGALSVRISAQLGKYLPWFQLFLYVIYLMTGLYGLIA